MSNQDQIRSLATSALKATALELGVKMNDYRDLEAAVPSVTVDDDGTVHGCAGAIESLRIQRPHLFLPDGGNKRDGRTSSPGSDSTDETTARNAMQMTDAEFAAAKRRSKVWRDVQIDGV